jgi:hypothetical protein
LGLSGSQPAAQAANSVVAHDVIVEPATLISAGFEWSIEGDANRNAAVAVTHRRKGDTGWRNGLPLLRIGGERTVFEGALDYTAPQMFAGSLFNLTENTEYEVQFTLSDPDGVTGADAKGSLTSSVTLRTRAEPQASSAGRTFHVYPLGHQGEAGAGLPGAPLRVLHRGHRRRLEPRVTAPRTSGRHDPGPCRRL